MKPNTGVWTKWHYGGGDVILMSAIIIITLRVLKVRLGLWERAGLSSRPGHRGRGGAVYFLAADSTHRMTDKPTGSCERVSSAPSRNERALEQLSVCETKCTRRAQVQRRQTTNLLPAVPQQRSTQAYFIRWKCSSTTEQLKVTNTLSDTPSDPELVITVMSCYLVLLAYMPCYSS